MVVIVFVFRSRRQSGQHKLSAVVSELESEDAADRRYLAKVNNLKESHAPLTRFVALL